MLKIHYWSDVWVSMRGHSIGYRTILRKTYRFIHDHHPVGRESTLERSHADALYCRQELNRMKNDPLARPYHG